MLSPTLDLQGGPVNYNALRYMQRGAWKNYSFRAYPKKTYSTYCYYVALTNGISRAQGVGLNSPKNG